MGIYWFSSGGFIMIPLIICSVLVWAVAIEKIIFLYVFSKKFRDIHMRLLKLVKESKIHEAKGLCISAHPLLVGPYSVLFNKGILSQLQWEAQIGRKYKEAILQMKKYLWILGTIGASAPFIGLFGTVVGIIKSFSSIAASGKSGFSVVAAGLSEALVATAAGIIVAVVAVVFFNYFQTKIKVLAVEVQHRLDDLIDIVVNINDSENREN